MAWIVSMYCAWLSLGNNVLPLIKPLFSSKCSQNWTIILELVWSWLEIWIFMVISYYVTECFKTLYCSGENAITLWISMCKYISLTWTVSMKRNIIPIILFRVTSFWVMGLDTLLSSSICTLRKKNSILFLIFPIPYVWFHTVFLAVD